MNKKKLLKNNIKKRVVYNTKSLIKNLGLFSQNVGLSRNAKLTLLDEFIATSTRFTKLGYKKDFLELDVENERVKVKDNITKWDEKRIKKINKEIKKIIKDKPDKLTNYQLLKKQGYSKDEINEKLSAISGKAYNLSYKAINKLSKKTLITLISAKTKEKYEDFYLENRDLIISYNKAIGEEKKKLASQIANQWTLFNASAEKLNWIENVYKKFMKRLKK